MLARDFYVVKRLRTTRPKGSYRASHLARCVPSFEGSTGLWQRISPPQLLVSSFLLLIGLRATGLMLVNLHRLTRDIVLFTFLIEAAGAVMLWLVWSPRLGGSQAWWPAVFHAVSAFCSAGKRGTCSESLAYASGPQKHCGLFRRTHLLVAQHVSSKIQFHMNNPG